MTDRSGPGNERSTDQVRRNGRRSTNRNGHAEFADRLAAKVATPAPPDTRTNGSPFEADLRHAPGTGFPQSIASGDPTPSGVVLWTRIDPDRYEREHGIGVVVAEDPDFETVVYRGSVTDPDRIAAHDHTLTIDLDGELDADRTYYYRFTHAGYYSHVGRCRTLPEPGREIESMSFAVLTCQDYQNGYYGAYARVAEEDVDFVIHVGDFIYESSEGEFAGRADDFPDRDITLPSGHDRAFELADYRHLYRTYKSDPHCQRALRRHTMIAGRDDHEVANDVYWDYETNAPGADHPRGDDPEFMRRLAADAIHAWWEYMPVRVGYDPNGETLHERFQLWRTFEFGDLLELIVTDERLFRSPPREGIPTERAIAPRNEPPDRTMLGADQREWFLSEITSVDAQWTVWCDEVLTVPFRVGAGRASVYPVPGSWDGYARERETIARTLHEAGVENFVTLTGDMHCYIAGYKQRQYRDAIDVLRDGPVPEADRVGVEFMTPAMTSITVAEGMGLGGTRFEAPVGRLLADGVRVQNPHIEFFDSHHNGYSIVTFTREACTYAAYAVDKTTNSAYPDRELLGAYRVPEGRVVLEDITARMQSKEPGEQSAAGNADDEPLEPNAASDSRPAPEHTTEN